MNRQLINFNVNSRVRVRLSESGKQELRKKQEQTLACVSSNNPLHNEPAFVVDADGYTEFQLWVLIRELGHMFDWGCEIPIDAEIQLVVFKS